MEFVRLKYANNKLINADIKEHREIITEFVEKKGYDYLGYIPTTFGPSGKVLEVDLIFRKPMDRTTKVARPNLERSVVVSKTVPAATPPVVAPAVKPAPKPTEKSEPVKRSSKPRRSNDLYNDHDLDLILMGGGDDLLSEEK